MSYLNLEKHNHSCSFFFPWFTLKPPLHFFLPPSEHSWFWIFPHGWRRGPYQERGSEGRESGAPQSAATKGNNQSDYAHCCRRYSSFVPTGCRRPVLAFSLASVLVKRGVTLNKTIIIFFPGRASLSPSSPFRFCILSILPRVFFCLRRR